MLTLLWQSKHAIEFELPTFFPPLKEQLNDIPTQDNIRCSKMSKELIETTPTELCLYIPNRFRISGQIIWVHSKHSHNICIGIVSDFLANFPSSFKKTLIISAMTRHLN